MLARRLIVVAILAMTSAAANANDEPAPAKPDPGVQVADARHRHLGFFIRPDFGFGYFRASGSPGGFDATLSGSAATLGVVVGGAVSENNIVAFHVWDMVVSNPTYSSGGSALESVDATVTLVGLGPQYTVYLGDNLYWSMTPSLTRGTISSQGTSSDTDWGFGLRAAMGKEWWIADHWGLGIAAHFSLSMNRAAGTDGGNWT